MNTTNSVRNIPIAIRALLDREGLTATEFAATIGVSNASVSFWLSGKNRIHPKMVVSIRKVYPDFLRDGWKTFAECKPFDRAAIEIKDLQKQGEIWLAYWHSDALYAAMLPDGTPHEWLDFDAEFAHCLWRYPNSN